MKENESTVDIKEGAPWKNAAKFDTWKKADEKRNSLSHSWKKKGDTHMQVKVKKLATGFVVKVRSDPAIKKLNQSKKKKKTAQKKR